MSDGWTGWAARRLVGEPKVIAIEVRTLDHLFNSLDPSPFHEKSIDDAAVEYIVQSARDHALRTPVKLRVHVLEGEIPDGADAGLANAIRSDMSWRAGAARRDLRNELWIGRVSLLIAAIFLALCVTARELVPHDAWWTVVREGLVIVGWVAMWQPLHAFLYGWWPILARQRLYEKLRDMPVELWA